VFHLIYLEFKDGRVDGFCSVAFEAADDGAEDSLSDGHLLGVVVPRSLTEKHMCCVLIRQPKGIFSCFK